MDNNTLELVTATLNVRGLRNKDSRSAVFQWANEKKIDILFLQETFWTQDIISQCETEWDGSCYYTLSDSKHSRGVAILISNFFKYSLTHKHQTNDG